MSPKARPADAQQPSTPAPTKHSLAAACTDFFLLGLQISSGSVELPTCESLKRRVLVLFDTLKNKAHKAGVLPTDVEDASYALAAYLDEVIHYSEWQGKHEWAKAPLQAMLFGESKAGRRFFERLPEIRKRSPAALEVCYLCLTLGFQGEYRLGGADQLRELVDDLRRDLGRTGGKTLSPHGKRPDKAAFGGRGLPVLPVVAACLALSVAVVVLLYLVLASTGSDAAELLGRLGRT